MTNTHCLVCGKELTPPARKFCDHNCQLAVELANKRQATIDKQRPKCLNCDANVGPGKAKYCSTRCRILFNMEKAKLRQREDRRVHCRLCRGKLPEGERAYCSDKCRKEANRVRNNKADRILNDESMREMRAATCDMVRRACMWCGKTFVSEGPFNRKCGACKKRDAVAPSISVYEEAYRVEMSG